MISVQQEKLQDILGEIVPLWRDHHEEVSPHNGFVELEPDYNSYFNKEDSGTLLMYTARDGDRLVGYICFVLGRSLHYKSMVVADNALFYVVPKYRGSGLGTRLLTLAEWYLKDIGIDAIYVRSILEHDFGELLEKEGYSPSERLFIKRLN